MSTPSTMTDDPEKLLNEWLGELKTIIGDLDIKTAPEASSNAMQTNVPTNHRIRKNKTSDFNRFSMANLEDSHETELDAILGELSLLEMDKSLPNKTVCISSSSVPGGVEPIRPTNCTHHRTGSVVSSSGTSTISSLGPELEPSMGPREPRTESPDNDSAFSDTVSLLSTDTSSTSSGLTNGLLNRTTSGQLLGQGLNLQEFDNQKAAKIHLAMQKLEQASVRRLFVKAFTADGASKSLLVDEKMTSGHITRLLADKNHVRMDPRWALVEQLPEIQMERFYEDHELLVDKLMMWDRDSKNRILFVERREKVQFFLRPELYLAESGSSKDIDECSRNFLLEDFCNTNGQIPMEGVLNLRTDSKKGWKRHHFVLRGSGLYYYPKEKTRSPRDLVCLGLLNDCEVYKGFGWKKKYKAPSDYTFILHAAHELANSKTTKQLKILCADDGETLEKWILAIRIAKYGKQLWQSYKALREDLARDDFDEMTTQRSGSINSFSESTLVIGNGRPLSRASSSSSSGCLSDENNGFDSEFTTGTIKRKPSMKPNLPLTSMTRQLKEVGENRPSPVGSPERGGTLTRSRPSAQPQHMRQRSIDSNGSSGSGCSTLKRRPQLAEKKELVVGGGRSTPETHKPATVMSPLQSMPSSMTDSVFSLPPPPEVDATQIELGSTLSMDSLPPPPSVIELEESLLDNSISDDISIPDQVDHLVGGSVSELERDELPTGFPLSQPKVSSRSSSISGAPKRELESCLKKESIYGTTSALKGVPNVASPVTMRKKVCFEDQVVAQSAAASPSRRLTASSTSSSLYGSLPPKPPPRSEATRLSTQPTAAASNNEFLKDLQRVMRKKWQVAQKCKLEPETNPHEVLGFRDWDFEMHQQNQLPYYRQTANVSNWVQEHYGPDSLYENLGFDGSTTAVPPRSGGPAVESEDVSATVPAAKKRPPPLPPKRSETTQLSMQSQCQSPVHHINGSNNS